MRAFAAEGQSFIATYLLSGEEAAISSGPFQNIEERVLRFDHYQATYDNKLSVLLSFYIVYHLLLLHYSLKVCLDTLEICIWKSDRRISITSRKWETVSLLIPRDTKRVLRLSLRHYEYV